MSAEPIRIFLGFDQVESVACSVFENSIQRYASRPVSITRISLRQLTKEFQRERDPKQSNDFSFSRWLVPYLSNYEGWSLFADCDMLCLSDIAELWALRDPQYAVQVVKHEHRAKLGTKYLGQPQTPYAKKNWSSVILFNNDLCTTLTPSYVNHASGLELHQFKWLLNDTHIGEIPPEWNHLVGVHEHNPDAKIVHWTEGGPYFHDYAMAPFSAEWAREFRAMTHCNQIISEPER